MTTTDGFWVFGYGSLMWSPGFVYQKACMAGLEGYHRDLCILSYVFRGTPAVPGLVMGLIEGGQCLGRAFYVEESRREETLTYLHEREMINDVYAPSWVDVKLEDGSIVSAYTFLAIPEHEQYVGQYSQDEKVDLVLQGVGKKGTSLEYLENTLDHLHDLSINDPTLEAIFADAVLRNCEKS